MDSLNSNFHFFPRHLMVVIVLGVLAENVETGDEISCSRSSPRTMDEQQLQNAAF